MKCADCGKWTTQVKTVYDDGSEVINFRGVADRGRCEELGMPTKPDFGCVAFAPGGHVRVSHKPGAPWHHFEMIPCPDCRGAGSSGSACNRCVGTGKVRKYDDGFIGEERTRKHPRELELPPAEPLRCAQCQGEVDERWVACPLCGARIKIPPAEVQVIEGLGTAA